ncbi:hypothetical protein [Thiolinea disciformis]|uniref:hypothetical protein n=1 Tax=Thiolinea disciformis TaxID=125614 RepID=UPI000382DA56|nr:hypothetical protein [Thiolinea disciformis]
MNILHYISLAGQQLAAHRQKAKTLQQLRELNEDNLVDIGISSALLRQGVSAYPWTLDQAVQDTPHVTYNALLAFNNLYSTALNAANQDTEERRAA